MGPLGLTTSRSYWFGCVLGPDPQATGTQSQYMGNAYHNKALEKPLSCESATLAYLAVPGCSAAGKACMPGIIQTPAVQGAQGSEVCSTKAKLQATLGALSRFMVIVSPLLCVFSAPPGPHARAIHLHGQAMTQRPSQSPWEWPHLQQAAVHEQDCYAWQHASCMFQTLRAACRNQAGAEQLLTGMASIPIAFPRAAAGDPIKCKHLTGQATCTPRCKDTCPGAAAALQPSVPVLSVLTS